MLRRLFNGSAERLRAGAAVLCFLAITLVFAPAAYAAQSGGSGGGAASGAAGAAACSISLGPILASVGAVVSSTWAELFGDEAAGVHTGSNAEAGSGGIAAGEQAANTGLAVNSEIRQGLLDCIARSIAKAVLQQVTNSVVNWINSGFNGQPSFVSNYNQFFQNVGDRAVGNIIQGSGLAFLCSPFQLQIRIKLAQIYANNDPSRQCSLTQVVGNVNGFLNNFNQGGWPAFLSLTTVPTNNPYGALFAAQTTVEAGRMRAQNTQLLDLQLGRGILSAKYTDESSCVNVPADQAPQPSDTQTVTPIKPSADTPGDIAPDANLVRVCQQKIGTPGEAIQASLDKTLGTNIDSLNTAKYFDEIISALITQLIQQTLYAGLSALGGSSGNYAQNFNYSIPSVDSILSQEASQLSQNIQSVAQQASSNAYQYQQNVNNLRAMLDKLNSLDACWIQKGNQAKAAAGGTSGTNPPIMGVTVGGVPETSDTNAAPQTNWAIQSFINASSTEATSTTLLLQLQNWKAKLADATSTLAQANQYQGNLQNVSASQLAAMTDQLSSNVASLQNKQTTAAFQDAQDQKQLDDLLSTINGQVTQDNITCHAPTATTTAQ